MLDIGSVKLPLNSVTRKFAGIAKSGAGKTYFGGVFAEELSKAGVPFVVFDPIDVWWGLRLKADGKSPALPVIVFGIRHADLPLEREWGSLIAEAVVKQNISCVISTFGLSKNAANQIMTDFARRFLFLNDRPRHVFIEEAHQFLPQRLSKGNEQMFSAVRDMVVLGRNQGIGSTLLNQRSATINKDVFTQVDTLIALRSVGPPDKKALLDWVKEQQADETNLDAFVDSLPKLPTGEGWIWSPEHLGFFEKIKIRKRETFHPDREKIGGNIVIPSIEQVDVQGFIESFRSQVTRPPKKGADRKAPDIQAVVEFKPMPGYQGIQPAKTELMWREEIRQLKNEFESALLQKDSRIRSLEEKLAQVRRVVGAPAATSGLDAPGQLGGISEKAQMWLAKLGNGGKARIFSFLATYSDGKFSREQVALAAGLSVRSSTFITYIARLKGQRLICEEAKEIFLNPELR